MRVLVTNDDGIEAPGLRSLALAASNAGYEVVIAAPANQSSGSSASITATESDGRIDVEPRSMEGLGSIPAFAVGGGPGLIALIAARGAFGPAADIVLSGVNHGANVGRAILHSGTVGAALTGGLHGAWAIAVSLDVGLRPMDSHWDLAADAAIELVPRLTTLARGTVLNVNVPNSGTPRGITEARLAPFGIVQTTLSERESGYVRLSVEELPSVPEPGTDAAWLAEGWVTVTALTSVADRPLGIDLD